MKITGKEFTELLGEIMHVLALLDLEDAQADLTRRANGLKARLGEDDHKDLCTLIDSLIAASAAHERIGWRNRHKVVTTKTGDPRVMN